MYPLHPGKHFKDPKSFDLDTVSRKRGPAISEILCATSFAGREEREIEDARKCGSLNIDHDLVWYSQTGVYSAENLRLVIEYSRRLMGRRWSGSEMLPLDVFRAVKVYDG